MPEDLAYIDLVRYYAGVAIVAAAAFWLISYFGEDE